MNAEGKQKYLEGLSYSVAYNNYSNAQDTGVCFLIKEAIKKGVVPDTITQLSLVDRSNIVSKYGFNFNGVAIQELEDALNVLGYKSKEYTYLSFSQFIAHQKALIFANELKNEAMFKYTMVNSLIAVEEGIDNFDTSIWNEYALRVYRAGLQELWRSSEAFQKTIQKTGDGLLYVNGDDPYWYTSKEMAIQEMLLPKRGKDMNILGKLLTVVKYGLE